MQLGIDSALDGSWDGVRGNLVKTGLGLISMGLNVVFMIQHYIIYNGNEQDRTKDSEETDDEESSGEAGTSRRNETTPLLHPSE